MAQAPRSSRLLRWSAAALVTATLGLGAVTSAHASGSIDPSTISANSITVTSFPCPATSNGLTSISGNITFSTAPANGATLNLAVYVHIQPSQGGDSKFHLITTPGFNANYDGTQTQATIVGDGTTKTFNYTVSFTAVPLANSYRIQVGSPYTEDQSQNYTKSGSVSCPIGTSSGGGGGGTDTPELGSGELLATGLLPIAGILLYRRSRRRR